MTVSEFFQAVVTPVFAFTVPSASYILISRLPTFMAQDILFTTPAFFHDCYRLMPKPFAELTVPLLD